MQARFLPRQVVLMSQVLEPIVPLTEARTQLFRLAEQVLSGEASRVRLSHRSHADDLLMVRASVFEQLEREVAELRRRVAPDVRALANLGALVVDDDEFLEAMLDLRADAAVASDRKQHDLARGLRYATPASKLSRVAEATPERAAERGVPKRPSTRSAKRPRRG